MGSVHVLRWSLRLVVVGLGLGLVGLAEAAEPVVVVDDAGAVVGRVEVDAPAEAVRVALADAAWAARLSPDVLSAVVQDRGGCEQVDLRARGLLSPIAVRTLRCASADGFSETLVASEAFSAWESRWTVEPAEGGAHVSFSLDARLTWPVPAGLVRSRLGASVRTTLRRLVTALEG